MVTAGLVDTIGLSHLSDGSIIYIVRSLAESGLWPWTTLVTIGSVSLILVSVLVVR